MPRIYSEKTIRTVKQLHEQGLSIRKIMKITGIKSSSTVVFHCSEEYREKMRKSGQRWRDNNRERWNEICRASYRKAKKKKKNK